MDLCIHVEIVNEPILMFLHMQIVKKIGYYSYVKLLHSYCR